MAERSKAIFGQKNEYQDWTLQGLIEHGSVPTAETYSVLRDVSDAIAKSKRDRDAEINKVTEEFRQRMLDAQLKIDKEELNEQAIKNERVFKNDKNNLEERLNALDEYYVRKKAIEDKEFKRDTDRLKFLYKDDDETFKKEYDALEKNRASQRMNIQADAEKQVFDIVYSSLHNDFERIKKLNRDQIGEQQENYIKDLKSLNAQLDSKKISLRKYAIERRRIDEEYRVKKLDDDIKDDENDLKRLYDHKKNVEDLQEESNKRLGGALSIALGGTYADKGSNEENKKEIDQARGEADALIKINDEVNAEIETREQKNRDNREQREKRHYDNLKDYAQQYVDELLNIIDAMYLFFKSISDRELENEIALLQRRFKVMEEGYKMEESAIERSNLANKEKVILETQLQAQQMVAQKNEQAQEKALKRQKAESDKKYSIFKMTIDTAEAVMAALKILPPVGEIIAAERAAAGAIRIATVIATPLPEFAEGVENFSGGYARTGEAGAEIIEEPFKKPYIVLKDNISYLPKGTNVVPIDDDMEKPSIGDNFEQIKWLASRLVKSKPVVNNNIKNTIVIDMGFETYKKQILG